MTATTNFSYLHSADKNRCTRTNPAVNIQHMLWQNSHRHPKRKTFTSSCPLKHNANGQGWVEHIQTLFSLPCPCLAPTSYFHVGKKKLWGCHLCSISDPCDESSGVTWSIFQAGLKMFKRRWSIVKWLQEFNDISRKLWQQRIMLRAWGPWAQGSSAFPACLSCYINPVLSQPGTQFWRLLSSHILC